MSDHPVLDLSDVMRVGVDVWTKGFGVVGDPVSLGAVAAKGWSVDDLPPPVLVLRRDALEHNVAVMEAYCRTHHVELAPHGKTTMAPQLWDRQLRAGAWGITAASVGEVRVMRDVGVPRVLLANELVDPWSIAWVAEQMADPAFGLVCYVDSERTVSILSEELARRSVARPVPVLVELGHAGGRTGCRSVGDAVDVARLALGAPTLELVGVAGYEGTICHDRGEGCIAAVRAFLDDLRRLAETLIEASAFAGDEVLVTAGGSAFFDLVVERLSGGWPTDANIRLVLRSGCYLTHDSGLYERLSPLSSEDPGGRFRPALEVWSRVLSRPEGDLAILGMGKRDVAFDFDPPIPHLLRTAAGEAIDVTGRLDVTALNDQHAFCRVEDGLSLDVGDVVVSGISHPCTTFDKWRVIPMLDDDDAVVDAVATFF
jgi:D-serine deaminase-like pyridoxal phosphate-dependent protein